MKNIIIKKAEWALCSAFLLFSCSSHHSQWSHAKIHSQDEKFSYSKVCYRTKDPVHSFDLEFVNVAEQLKGYILIHSSPILSSSVKIKIEIDEAVYAEETSLLQGGQRLLLSEEMTQKLIGALMERKTVHISLPGYRGAIEGEGFQKHFSKLERSLMENPFHLPF